ncbi:unnamed protein product [Mytilus edulis]|uniref:DDE-1 domain-containing protein n=1 Tax=Mytilus edulis TaxID=6550 RepID=A0A8S3U7P2_MYTED|nr:unnamed protein product [Mytilus edulis]
MFKKEDEGKLVEYAEKRASLGIGFGKKTYLRYAGQLAQKKGINFKNKIPSDKWWRLHKKRFPDTLSLRKPEATAAIRHKQMNPENVGSYFDALKETLLKHQLMNSPEKIWNMDETYLPLSVDSEKVLTRKGARHVQSKTGFRESVTLIACANAAGSILPPHVIVKGKQKELYNLGTPKMPLQGLAELWFTSLFLPSIGPARPQVLIFDGHNSHNHVELLGIARQNNVEFVELPAHTSHWLQPLDRTYFGPLKTNWRQTLNSFTAETGCPITHGRFFHLFNKTWTETNLDITKIINGFKCTGIYPFNEHAIPAEAFLPNTIYVAEAVDTTSAATETYPCDNTITSDALIEEVSNEESLFEVMDLGITVDDSGVISSTSTLGVPAGTSIPTNLTPSACPPELALSALECSFSLQKREQYEQAFIHGKNLKEKVYETWKHYKQLVNNESLMEDVQEHSVIPSINDDRDIFSIPQLSQKKTEKKKYFVITCEEAYKEKFKEMASKDKSATTDALIEEVSNEESLFEVMDLGITVDDSGVISSTSTLGVPAGTSIPTNLTPSACPPE